MATMIGLTVLMLSTVSPIARHYMASMDIKEAVRDIHHTVISNYQLEVLKTRCFHAPTIKTMDDLIKYNPDLAKSISDRGWIFTYQYQTSIKPYPHPIRLDINVIFDNQEQLNDVDGYLKPSYSSNQTLTFSYPVTKIVSDNEQFDPSKGCIH